MLKVWHPVLQFYTFPVLSTRNLFCYPLQNKVYPMHCVIFTVSPWHWPAIDKQPRTKKNSDILRGENQQKVSLSLDCPVTSEQPRGAGCSSPASAVLRGGNKLRIQFYMINWHVLISLNDSTRQPSIDGGVCKSMTPSVTVLVVVVGDYGLIRWMSASV